MSKREWEFYLDDMMSFCKKILSYTAQLDQKGFETDEKSYDATIRNLDLLGEAAKHIPDTVRETCSSIPWRQIVATRNRLIHGYLGIDNDILWSIIRDDIPVLLRELEQLKGSVFGK